MTSTRISILTIGSAVLRAGASRDVRRAYTACTVMVGPDGDFHHMLRIFHRQTRSDHRSTRPRSRPSGKKDKL